MNDQFRPPLVDPITPLETLPDAEAARREEAEARGLPEHEIDVETDDEGRLIPEPVDPNRTPPLPPR